MCITGMGRRRFSTRTDRCCFSQRTNGRSTPGRAAGASRESERGAGLTINCPLAAGAGRAQVLGAMREELEPAAERFGPELVLISAGFDSRTGDPLGGFLLEDEDFAEMTRLVMGIAERHARCRVVSLLEGGYALGAAGKSGGGARGGAVRLIGGDAGFLRCRCY